MKLNSRIFVEFPPSWQKKKEPSIALEFWELYIWDYITLPYIWFWIISFEIVSFQDNIFREKFVAENYFYFRFISTFVRRNSWADIHSHSYDHLKNVRKLEGGLTTKGRQQ